MEGGMSKLKFLSEDETKELFKKFKGERSGWVRVGEKEWFLPKRYLDQAASYSEFKKKREDTWVLSHPRSGTTWTQEIIWLLGNNLDFETAGKILLDERFPFLDFPVHIDPEVIEECKIMNAGNEEKQNYCRRLLEPVDKKLDVQPSPRFIKSHLPISLLPGILDSGGKIVYVARNPKDVAVSWYNFHSSLKLLDFRGSFDEFWNFFQQNLTIWGPYWEHVKEAWSHRHHPNLLFIFYEELLQDCPKSIRKLSDFLGKSYTDAQILKVSEYVNFENLRNNLMVNSIEMQDCKIMHPGAFIRKGKSGVWNEYFSPELEAQADEWIRENLKDTDLSFPLIDSK